MSDDRAPVLIGVGQAVDHWDGRDPAAAPSPLSLGAAASRAALANTAAGAAVAAAIDTLVVVRTNLDSIPERAAPFPQCANLPAALAAAIGTRPRRLIYSKVGGDQPQALVNEFAAAVNAGEADVVLLAGAEAIAAMKTAARAGVALDWSGSPDAAAEDRGLGEPLLSRYELANGLGFPTETYPVFEQALRARLALSPDNYRRLMSTLWAGFSEVAAANSYSQFPTARTAEWLATPSPDNYPVTSPYLKWHVAQDAVNQGAALILTTAGRARALAVPQSRLIYLHGHAAAADRFVSERPNLSRSPSMEGVLARALASSGVTIADVAEIDLYSCFPCAVLIAAEALGLDWRARPLTVTGGLPFFGGAGNNYSMHAVATMVERLRARPATFGLVLANGGFLSKHAAGVYSTSPPVKWQSVDCRDMQAALDAQAAPQLVTAAGTATIDSYTLGWRNSRPERGAIVGTMAAGRVLARTVPGDAVTLALLAGDPLGREVTVRFDNGVNYFAVNA